MSLILLCQGPDSALVPRCKQEQLLVSARGRSLLQREDPAPHMYALGQPALPLCLHHAHPGPAHVLLRGLQHRGTELLPCHRLG